MSIGCENDVGVSSTFESIKSELTLLAKMRKFPLDATFELTPYCNLKCSMCYVRLDPAAAAKQGRIMSGKQWLEIGRQARDMGLFFITLTGGEPLLHPDFWEIYNGMTELGLLTSIYTNGCLIDEAVVEKLKANPPHKIKISVYGASNETYEKMCGVKDGFTRVNRAVELLREAGLSFYCTSTVVHDNAPDLLALYSWAREKQVPFFHTMAVANSARGALSDPLSVRMRMDEIGFSTLERIEKQKRPKHLNSPFEFCGGHDISFFMTWHGHMQFCGFAPKPYVQIEEPVNMEAAWQTMLAQTAAITLPPECDSCEHAEFCKRCPGLLASESGDPGRLSATFCQQAIDLHRLYDELKAEQAQTTPEEATK